MTKPTLLIFTKAPRIGLSKTRLAEDIGRSEARRIARALLAHTMRAADHFAWHTRLMIDPSADPSSTLGGLWPAHFERRAQTGRGLGERLANAMQDAPAGPILFIGTDAPDLSQPLLHQASRSLRRSGAVFGPALDGGFWLFGLSDDLRDPSIFNQVRWSSPHAMEDLWSHLPAHARVSLLPQLIDIDTGMDWERYKKLNRQRS